MAKREFGIDLLRIISAYFIIVVHLINKGGLFDNVASNPVGMFFVSLIYAISITGVNLFAMISGYVGNNKKFNLIRPIKIWLITVFYLLVIKVIFVCIQTPQEYTWIEAITPIISNIYWYVSSYIVLLILQPFINKIINATSNNIDIVVIIVLIILGSILPTTFGIDIININNGYSFVWILIMYVMGFMIKKHNINEKISKNKCVVIIILMVLVTISFPKIVSIFTLSSNTNHIVKQINYFNNINIVIETVCIFLIFSKINCYNSKINRIVSVTTTCSLAIYLIHTNPFIFENIINGILSNISNNVFVNILSLIGISIIIMIICIIIEKIRQRVLVMLNVNKFMKKVNGNNE